LRPHETPSQTRLNNTLLLISSLAEDPQQSIGIYAGLAGQEWRNEQSGVGAGRNYGLVRHLRQQPGPAKEQARRDITRIADLFIFSFESWHIGPKSDLPE
jgi:hypothetical protein